MKTNRTIIILAIFVAIFFSACDKNSFTISGTLENGADKTIYLEELTPEGTLFIDSIKLDNQGHFKYSYKMPYQSLYNLHTTADNYIILLPDYGEKIDSLLTAMEEFRY